MVNVRPLDNIVSATARTESIIASVSASSESSYSSVGVIDVTYYYNLCKQYAEQSANSATSASNSATSASGYATNASTSATNAYNYSINAYNSAELARQYSEMFSHVQISTTQPTDTSVDVWLDPSGTQGKLSQLTNDVGFITASYHDNTKQDVISDLATIRSNASSALQPNDNITELTNNAGYQNSSQVSTAITTVTEPIQSTVSTIQTEVTSLTSTTSTLQTSVTSIQTTIGNYGDVVSHNASEFYLATNPSGYQNATQVNTAVTAYHDDTKYDASNPNGYTSNTGTITGITMNGASKGTSGVVDLGTVITSHQDISGKENTSNKVTSITSSSTDTQYPSAKCVYDIVGNIETLLQGLR